MLRGQQDLNEGKTIFGAMVTAVNRDINDPALDFLHRSAYTGGHRFLPQLEEPQLLCFGQLRVQPGERQQGGDLQRPRSRRALFPAPGRSITCDLDPNRTSLGGYGGNFEIGKSGNSKLTYSAGVTWRSPGLELNDMGYLHQADVIMAWGWAGYKIMQADLDLQPAQHEFQRLAGVQFRRRTDLRRRQQQLLRSIEELLDRQFRPQPPGSEPVAGRPARRPLSAQRAGLNQWFVLGSDTRKRLST